MDRHRVHVTVAGKMGSGYLRVARAIENAVRQAGAQVEVIGHTVDYDAVTNTQMPADRTVIIEIHQQPHPLIETE